MRARSISLLRERKDLHSPAASNEDLISDLNRPRF